MTLPNLYLGSTLISPRIAGRSVVSTPRTSSTDATIAYTAVATSATAHTKGSWVELVASTAGTVDMVRLLTTGTGASASANGALVDIGIGSGGSETVLVANVAIGSRAFVDIPIAIAAGTRIAVRWQSSRTSASAASMAVQLLGYPASTVRSPSTIATIGADTATSAGVSLGTTSNVWVQVTASTAAAYQGVVVCPVSTDTTMAAGSNVAFDIGVGGSGSEVAAVGNAIYVTNSDESMQVVAGTTYIPVDIPAGSRIAARYIDASTGNAGYSVVLLGVPA